MRMKMSLKYEFLQLSDELDLQKYLLMLKVLHKPYGIIKDKA